MRWNLSVATATNALATLSIQIVALTALTPVEFGKFSIQYLLYALASSLVLSVVSEAWQRRHRNTGDSASWQEFGSVSLYLALGAGLLTLLVGLVAEPLRTIALAGAIAVAAATYRGAIRYFYLRFGMWKEAILPDALSLAATVGLTAAMFGTSNPSVEIFTAIWASASVISAASSRPPRVLHPRVVTSWTRAHRDEIRPLLRDSLLMDLGAVGTPYLLAPILGLAHFGTYRAVSNVAAPVRLILNPLRPLLASRNLISYRSLRQIIGSVAASAAFGGGAYLALVLIRQMSFDLGVLSSVADYALPTSIFVAANFLGLYYYIIARTHMSSGGLLFGRVVQTVFAVIVPVGLALTTGLYGAIWGLAGATLVSSVVWACLVVKAPRRAT